MCTNVFFNRFNAFIHAIQEVNFCYQISVLDINFRLSLIHFCYFRKRDEQHLIWFVLRIKLGQENPRQVILDILNNISIVLFKM